MQIEFLHQEGSRRRKDVKKFTLRISNLHSLDDFLEILLIEMELMRLFTFTPSTMIGVEVHSNLIPDANVLYIPIRTKNSLTNHHLIRELERMTNSGKIFLDLDQAFEIVISVIQV